MLLPNAKTATITGLKPGAGLFMEGNDYVHSAYVEVTLDRGSRHGVSPGAFGFLTDKNGNLVRGGRFDIKPRGTDNSFGQVRMGMDRVKSYGRTVLVHRIGFPLLRRPLEARLVDFKLNGGTVLGILNRGNWRHSIDTNWKVEGRRSPGDRPEVFPVVRVNQMATKFQTDLTIDMFKRLKFWRIVP